ncbi:MAG: penicillin-binding protein 2 [Anaerolineae bacterium]|nr:penicillin-binding protein 2 [Anaerolineae bacterium]
MKTQHHQLRYSLISLPLVAIMVWSAYHGVGVYIKDSDTLLSNAEYEQTRVRLDIPFRGNILSSDGSILAATVPAYRVQVNPYGLVSSEANVIEPLMTTLSPILDTPPQKLREQLSSAMEKRQATILGIAVPETRFKDLKITTTGLNPQITSVISYTRKINGEMKVITTTMSNFISLSSVSKREYPNGTLAGPVLGTTIYSDTVVYSEPFTRNGKLEVNKYTAFITEGKSGLELALDDELRGTVGVRKARSPLERSTVSSTLPAINVVSTLDLTVQQMAERMLDQAYQKYKLTGGVIIIMDVKTGDIYAMATRINRPAYDPNQPLDAWEDAVNPAVSAIHVSQPGSTIKPIVIASAIEHGRAIETYDDPGFINVRGTYIENYRKTSFGKVDLMKLFLHSINTYTVRNAQNLGAELFYQQYKLFGLTEKTGIELKGEESWGNIIMKGDKTWTESTMASDAFGQSMTVTPLQMTRAFAALGNEGKLVQPRLVREFIIDGTRKVLPPGPQHNAVSPAAAQRTLGLMRDALIEKNRLDRQAGLSPNVIPGYTFAGKTGTAQWFKNGLLQDTHIVSFAGLIPANEPRLAIFVKLNEPRVNASTEVLAGATALPVWRDVADQAVRLLDIKPDSK